ncbi:MAG TPA: hypothetical protein VGJ59_09525 [Jatrophihabitantaceae bacterium]|jgi:hypothetical protein
MRKKILLSGLLATAAIGGSIALASSANAVDAPATPILDTPDYVSYTANCTPGVTTHTDYKWVPNVSNAGPTMWTVNNAPANFPATFTWKGADVAYHRDGTKTQQATDTQCGVHITTQDQADALSGTTINKNVDVTADTARPDGSPIWLQWAHITGNVTIEGKVFLSADTVDGNVSVSGPGSFLGLSNYASHFARNLTVQNSTGIYTGGPGTTSFGNWTQYNGASQVDGNFSFTGNDGGLYSGYPMHVTGSFTYTGNTGPVLDRGGLTVDGPQTVSG